MGLVGGMGAGFGGAPKRHRGVDITPGSAFKSLVANKAAGKIHSV